MSEPTNTYAPGIALAGICLLRVLTRTQPKLTIAVIDEMHKVMADGFDILKEGGPQAFEDQLMESTRELILEAKLKLDTQEQPTDQTDLRRRIEESTKG